MSTCLDRAPFTGQAITAGAVPDFGFTEQQSDIRTSLFIPHRVLTLRPFQAARDSPHSLWLSRARRRSLLYRRRSRRPVSFRTARLFLKRRKPFRVPSLPLSDTQGRSCRKHSTLPSWVRPKLDRSKRA